MRRKYFGIEGVLGADLVGRFSAGDRPEKGEGPARGSTGTATQLATLGFQPID